MFGAGFDEALPDLAVGGETGIDVFERLPGADRRPGRFRCLGTVAAGGGPEAAVAIHEPGPGVEPARLRRAAAALAAAPALSRPFSLADATGFPAPAAAGEPLALFLRLDFLRARQLADLGLDRLEAGLAAGPGAAFDRPGAFPALVAQAYDFNRIARGTALARLVLPHLPPPAACDDGIAFGLRMLGDLALRGGAAGLALACFEAALAIGDNPHRRARARAAAAALGDPAALARHAPPPPRAPAPPPADLAGAAR